MCQQTKQLSHANRGTTSGIAPNKNRKTHRVRVSFGSITLHEFEHILGDNPAVSEGAPLTIGWKPMASTTIDIESFEDIRSPQRREATDLQLSSEEREMLLLSNGYKFHEIFSAALEASIVQDDRMASFKNKKWDVLKEKAKYGMNRLRGKKGKQRKHVDIDLPKRCRY